MSGCKHQSRREFLAAAGSSAALFAAAPLACGIPAAAQSQESGVPRPESKPYASEALFKAAPQRTFSGDEATQVAMPLGGIGTGAFCLNGYGGTQDFSIRSKPEISALPAGFTSNSNEAAFGLLHIKGDAPVTRLIEGPFPAFKIYDQGLQGQGLRRGGYEGFPRFKKAVFEGEYPFANVAFSDSAVPLDVSLTAWNPFIPLDDKNSGIPCAILEYTFRNTSAKPVEYEFSYHLSHLAPGCKPEQASTLNAAIAGKGAFLSNSEPLTAESYGSCSLTVIGATPRVKAMWLRSPGWEFDSLSALWREVSTGTFTENSGSNGNDISGRNGASILLAGRLAPGQSVTYPIVISWHFPNGYLRWGSPGATGWELAVTSGCQTTTDPAPPWRPHYAALWSDAREVALYVEREYTGLRSRTVAFKKALFQSTLPPYVLDAVSANLAILKSPTVLRLENGGMWGWEGCNPHGGCCPGSCTHVWNYAQAFPHLYPQLERTLRSLELVHSMDENGHVAYRSAIPLGPTSHRGHSAADGQLGGIMKLFRDWQISGDLAWMADLYPLAKRSLDYSIATWDPDRRGSLSEPHHNTYDIEFWGPESMSTGIYLGALSAMARMAKALDRPDDAQSYGELAGKAAAFMEENLFNGEYYQQKVEYEDLKDQSFAKLVAGVTEQSSEMQQLLRREGPKYQYGTGCLSDAVIGLWMAQAYGIETPLAKENVRKTLGAIFKHNFRADLSDHANAQRPGYAMGHDPGLLICSWPRGGKPTLPFVYSDEVWTGVEYQVASHLIAEGLVEEGLTIVKALRSRYDGRIRNPWSEYEAGNFYARAMASYALLGALSGFRYSAAERTLWFSPRLETEGFRCFFSTASGFGTIARRGRSIDIDLIEGELIVEKLVLGSEGQTRALDWKIHIKPGVIASIAS